MLQPWSAMDVGWMRRALELAGRGRGAVEPNPLVGAVLIREAEVVGEGWHQRFGGPHAEVEALRTAGDAARGATCYVTLEPCCHCGKTPPCTRALIQARVARVIAACRDPFPPVAANGLSELRAAGIAVEAGLLRREAQELNAPYFKLRATGRPFVTAKWAMTLDGKVASRTGDSRWVSSPEARERVQRLRAVSDAVLVGIGTVLADDPLLTCRKASPRTLTRIVLDSSARLPLGSRLVETAAESPVLVAATGGAAAERMAALRARGVEVLLLPAVQDRVSLEGLLDELGRRGMTNLLVEGGPTVFADLFARRLVDRAVVYLAAKLIGGERAPGALGGEGVATMADALGLELQGCERVGQDLELLAAVSGVFGAYFPAE